MDKKETLHQGEVLLFLSNRSPLAKEAIAEMLEINPSYLSRLYKSQLLTQNIKKKAAAIFGVDVSFFDLNAAEMLNTKVGEPEAKYLPANAVGNNQLQNVLNMMRERHEQHCREMLKFFALMEGLMEGN